MMYIVTKSDQMSWHVGNKKPTQRMGFTVYDVIEVQADCDELQYVLSKFENIRCAKDCRIMRWFGDDAKFIVANL